MYKLEKNMKQFKKLYHWKTRQEEIQFRAWIIRLSNYSLTVQDVNFFLEKRTIEDWPEPDLSKQELERFNIIKSKINEILNKLASKMGPG